MEARGVSPRYERLVLGVADDPDLIAILDGLPVLKQQPNLLLAAVRYIAGEPLEFPEFRRLILERRDELITTMMSRLTQTNEPARCAALYPVLAALPQPLALLEVGASAGLCLLPDRYRYDYDGTYAGDSASPLVLHCQVDGGPRISPGRISVAWRAGIDLNPLDVTNADDVRWLEALIWPEQHERQRRLHAAIAIARDGPPRIVQGDLVDRLAGVAAQAPPHATLVVFHTATLNYLPAQLRELFAEQLRDLGGHWLSRKPPPCCQPSRPIWPNSRRRTPQRSCSLSTGTQSPSPLRTAGQCDG